MRLRVFRRRGSAGSTLWGGLARGSAYVVGVAALGALAFNAVYSVADAIGRHAMAAPPVAAAKVEVKERVVEHRVLQEDWFRSWGSSRARSQTYNSAPPPPPPRFDRSQRSNLMRPPEPPPFGFFGFWGDGRRDWYEPFPEPRQTPQYRTYRTVCVRLCDGFYFPISFSATSDRFARDEAACTSSCGSEARLFVYRNPGEEPEQMVDLRGQAYAKLKTAFLYRTTYNESCKCRPHAWEQVSLDRHRLYALEARRKKGDRSVNQEMDEIRQRQRQSALEQRTPRKQSETRQTTTSRRVAVAAPGGPVASDVPPALGAEAAPSPGPVAAPAPRGGEMHPNVANVSDAAVDGPSSLADAARPQPKKAKAKQRRVDQREIANRPSLPASGNVSWNRVFDR